MAARQVRPGHLCGPAQMGPLARPARSTLGPPTNSPRSAIGCICPRAYRARPRRAPATGGAAGVRSGRLLSARCRCSSRAPKLAGPQDAPDYTVLYRQAGESRTEPRPARAVGDPANRSSAQCAPSRLPAPTAVRALPAVQHQALHQLAPHPSSCGQCGGADRL